MPGTQKSFQSSPAALMACSRAFRRVSSTAVAPPELLEPHEELDLPPDPPVGVSVLPGPQPIAAAIKIAARVAPWDIVVSGRKARKRTKFDILCSFGRLVI